MTSSNERVVQVAVFVREFLEQSAKEHGHLADLTYRWEHTLRVTQYGKTIASAERANVEAVVIGCLLHDISRFEEGDDRNHGRLSATIARPFISGLGLEQAVVQNILYAVAVHVDGKADFDHPHTVEAMVISDADNIDRFGAYRILQMCCPDMADLPKLASRLRDRLPVLEKYRSQGILETHAGNEVFDRQLDRQMEMFKELIREQEIATLAWSDV